MRGAAGPHRRGRRGRAAGTRRHDDAGYSIVETVITVPVLILFTMTVVQYALVWHARHIAEAAAQDGLRVARGYQSTSAAGDRAATDYLHQVAPHLLTATSVHTTRTATTVSVHVHAHALTVLSLIPGSSFDVDETVSGPLERFSAPGS